MATDILVIEDEPLIAMDLKDVVEKLGHRVTGSARTHREAVAAFGAIVPGSSSPISSLPTAAPA